MEGFFENHLSEANVSQQYLQNMLSWSHPNLDSANSQNQLLGISRTESNGKRLSCSLCSKEFSTMSNLKQHMQVHEEKDNRQNFKCHICKKTYLYKCSLSKHLKTHAGGAIPAESDVTTATSSVSGHSDANLEPKSPKKVKVETNSPPVVNQLMPEKIREIIELNQKLISFPVKESYQFSYKQPLFGGGSQLLKITIEPIQPDSQSSWLNYGDNLTYDSRQREPAPSNPKKPCEDQDFIDGFFKEDDSVPLPDLGLFSL